MINVKSQLRMPVVEALRRYAEAGMWAYHTPGHKQGKGAAAALRDFLTPLGLAADVSLMSELDKCLEEAQVLAAELYNADRTFFVVNGTTAAVQAMIMAALKPGELLLAPRNVHKSVLSGICLAGADAAYMMPEIADDIGIAMAVSPDTVERSLAAHRGARAVLVVSPTYYGAAADLVRIAEIAHGHGAALLVDEAHGAHLPFGGDAMPLPALTAGADMVAQSTHKLLGSLTQTSMLHVKSAFIGAERAGEMLELLQSSSPNYLLFASLDAARQQMALQGRELVTAARQWAQHTRTAINKIAGLYCFGAERCGSGGLYEFDPMKLTVTVAALGITGTAAEKFLRRRYNIQVELVDAYNVLLIFSYADGEQEARRIIEALQGLAAEYGNDGGFAPVALPLYNKIPVGAMSPRQALFSDSAAIPLTEAAGAVCAEMITLYPPGIPLVCPGELLEHELIEYCLQMRRQGYKIVGPADKTMTTIRVVK